jgi:phosphate starvation-inducible PhoH-like protein
MPKKHKAVINRTRRNDRRSPSQSQDTYQEESSNASRVKPSLEPIECLTDAQEDYAHAIENKRVIFGVGPAGTGKTWLAAAMAADQLRDGSIEKIIITRPAVEAGEKLGFLPGDLSEKYAPYLAPIMEALVERLGGGHVEYLLRKEIIKPEPLAYMRGKTFKNAWILVDEAQNITKTQMKMLLTRIGEGSKMIVSGDIKQTDLAPGMSGLPDAIAKLARIKDISTIEFTADDIVRDDIVMDIIRAYEH